MKNLLFVSILMIFCGRQMKAQDVQPTQALSGMQTLEIVTDLPPTECGKALNMKNLVLRLAVPKQSVKQLMKPTRLASHVDPDTIHCENGLQFYVSPGGVTLEIPNLRIQVGIWNLGKGDIRVYFNRPQKNHYGDIAYMACSSMMINGEFSIQNGKLVLKQFAPVSLKYQVWADERSVYYINIYNMAVQGTNELDMSLQK